LRGRREEKLKGFKRSSLRRTEPRPETRKQPTTRFHFNLRLSQHVLILTPGTGRALFLELYIFQVGHCVRSLRLYQPNHIETLPEVSGLQCLPPASIQRGPKTGLFCFYRPRAGSMQGSINTMNSGVAAAAHVNTHYYSTLKIQTNRPSLPSVAWRTKRSATPESLQK
jgi:hypothetical protein